MSPVRYGGGGGGAAGPAGFTDEFSLAIKLVDSNATPTDDAAFAIALAQSDTIDVQTEVVSLGSTYADTSDAPTDLNSFTLRCWLSASAGTGVTNPANADGANNGTVATVTTAIGSPANETMTSALGANVPTAIITSAIYRGWFKSVNSLITSSGVLGMRSTTAAFTDKTMFSNAALNTTVDRLDGSFTYNLIANGIDTLAKIQSCQMIHSTTDLSAGVSPHILTVDSGCIELAGAF